MAVAGVDGSRPSTALGVAAAASSDCGGILIVRLGPS